MNSDDVTADEMKEWEDGEKIRVRPIGHLDVQIDATVHRILAGSMPVRTTRSSVKRLTIHYPLDHSVRSDVVRQLEALPMEHEEIWHQKYGELDSGNIIDGSGAVSRLLDRLASALGWPCLCPRFDKVMLRKSDDRRLSDFHADHFNSRPKRTRHRGTMERVIFNLGTASRWFAVLDIPGTVVSKFIKDPYSDDDYARLLSGWQEKNVFLYETPPVGPLGQLHGLYFDAFSTLHCGYGMRGDMAAVISRWIPKKKG